MVSVGGKPIRLTSRIKISDEHKVLSGDRSQEPAGCCVELSHLSEKH